MTKCTGCGITLQDKQINENGYTPFIKNNLCQRCFKLKNYNELTNKGVLINNEKLIDKINKLDAFVFFLTDFINIDSTFIKYYQMIKANKMVIITKADIIPKNIKYSKLISNIKNIYDINEDIILTSTKNNFNLKKIENLCKGLKKCVFVGFTNAGKSSLINALVKSDITVSSKENTTQELIKLKLDNTIIYDAPGLIDNINRENVPKKVIKPKVYQLLSKHYLLIDKVKLNIKENTNLTIYTSNDIKILRRKEASNVTCNVVVAQNSDVIIKGIGFIKFKDTALISLSTKDYEIRPSIIGGVYE